MDFIIKDKENDTSMISISLDSQNLKNDQHFIALKKRITTLETKLDKSQSENSDLRKTNKNLTTKINLLINDINILKNFKKDLDESDYPNYATSEDSLKEFFYLLVICEKMKYLNIEQIWAIESNILYQEVLSYDLPFYEWQVYIQQKFEKINCEIKAKTQKQLNSNVSVISKIKNLWFEASLNFYDKIKVVKDGPSSNNNNNNNNNNMNDNNSNTKNIQINKNLKRSIENNINVDKNIDKNKTDEMNEKKLKIKNDLRQKYSELINSNNKKISSNTNEVNDIEIDPIKNEAMLFDTDEKGEIVFNYKAAIKNGVIKDKDINKIIK